MTLHPRVTRFMQKQDGSRNLQLVVDGITITLSPNDAAQQARAEDLAGIIAELAPENVEPVDVVRRDATEVTVNPPRPLPASVVVPWKVGDRAYCTVHGAEGLYWVLAERGGSRQEIKVQGPEPSRRVAWCPAYNFARKDPRVTV